MMISRLHCRTNNLGATKRTVILAPTLLSIVVSNIVGMLFIKLFGCHALSNHTSQAASQEHRRDAPL